MGKKAAGWLLTFAAIGTGAVCMAYPFLSNYIYENRNDSLVQTYEAQAEDSSEADALLADAREYNEAIFTGHVQLHDPFAEEVFGDNVEGYENQLSLDGSDIIGFVDIPCIDVSLPIYHGTSAETLEKGIGHLEGTSLPVGGENTHCVLTGHTGLNSAKLFTDLTEMEEGDVFFLRVLNLKLAYEADQIKVVEPSELDDLGVVPGEDYCTLVTCTPYGINSHRLLVRGHRTDYEEAEEISATTEVRTSGSQWMRNYLKALACAFTTIVLFLLMISAVRRKRRKREEKVRKKGKHAGEEPAKHGRGD